MNPAIPALATYFRMELPTLNPVTQMGQQTQELTVWIMAGITQGLALAVKLTYFRYRVQ